MSEDGKEFMWASVTILFAIAMTLIFHERLWQFIEFVLDYGM